MCRPDLDSCPHSGGILAELLNNVLFRLKLCLKSQKKFPFHLLITIE